MFFLTFLITKNDLQFKIIFKKKRKLCRKVEAQLRSIPLGGEVVDSIEVFSRIFKILKFY